MIGILIGCVVVLVLLAVEQVKINKAS